MKNNSRGVINHPFISPFYSKYNRVESVKDGVLCQDCQFVEYSAIEDIHSVEFSLGNLIAIGADKNLTYVSMSLDSDMKFVDDFAQSYQTLTQNVQENH